MVNYGYQYFKTGLNMGFNFIREPLVLGIKKKKMSEFFAFKNSIISLFPKFQC